MTVTHSPFDIIVNISSANIEALDNICESAEQSREDICNGAIEFFLILVRAGDVKVDKSGFHVEAKMLPLGANVPRDIVND